MFKSDRPKIDNAAIIATFFLFFPACFVLIIVRAVKHRDLSYQKIGDLILYGKSLLIIFGLLSLSYFIQLFAGRDVVHAVFFVCCIILLLPALYLLWKASHDEKQLQKRYEYYRHIAISQGETSIGVISQITKQRILMVKNDLLRMIFHGLLEDCYIDEVSNHLVFPNRSSSHRSVRNEVAAADDNRRVKVKEEKLSPKKVECTGCGSISTLQPGESVFCSYCGASMVYPK
ncbi:hypothetical protein EHS13_01925 [Paenibacillus psychroresistens]|uniref:Uncharacterized protein n=1 Tax=Paenibacillus psychroresistens TaxID=1778678 RepID=A0A6B8RAL8_9BACL|nr:hypothetical protein [Paenibacillus psychroresistens]QGQ93751.1 hypothetical protein EHS13_01925 [Paenibacillus psychroresistens]